MKKHFGSFLVLWLALGLALTGCSFTVTLPNLPIGTLEVGETVIETLLVNQPDSAETPEVEINFGAGELLIAPGATQGLLTGKATYNVSQFKPVIEYEGNRVILRQGEKTDGITTYPNLSSVENTWDLQLSTQPMALTLNAGATNSEIDLSGLALTRLKIAQGASNVAIRFDEPNTVEMSTLTLESGAASMRVTGLANANSNQVIFRGGAGSYTLDFSGDLQRDLAVKIESGLSSMAILIPADVSARVVLTGAVTSVNLSGNWQQSGNEYVQTGSSEYEIVITMDMGAGSVDLRN
ncbi:MAG: hypothetical protein OHK0052_08490 [Anaerolineales bacterium]